MDKFYGHGYTGDGYDPLCKVCHKKKYLPVQRLRRQKLKRLLIFLGGGVCKRCRGLYPDCCYEFHHVNPKVKDDDLGHLHHVKAVEELKKCVLLCSTCHRLEHFYIREKDKIAYGAKDRIKPSKA